MLGLKARGSGAFWRAERRECPGLAPLRRKWNCHLMSWRVNTNPVTPHGTRAEPELQGEGEGRGAVTDLHPWRGTDPAPTSLTSQAGTSEAAQEKVWGEKLPLSFLCLSLDLPSAKKINKDQLEKISTQLEPGKSKGEKNWSGFSSSHPLWSLILSAARLLQSWFCFAMQSRACLSDLVFSLLFAKQHKAGSGALLCTPRRPRPQSQLESHLLPRMRVFPWFCEKKRDSYSLFFLFLFLFFLRGSHTCAQTALPEMWCLSEVYSPHHHGTEPDGGVRGEGRVDTKASPAQETAYGRCGNKAGQGK